MASQTKPTPVNEINNKSNNPPPQTQQPVKKYDSVGESIVLDLKGLELSNDGQKFVGKSFRGPKMSHIHWYANPTIEKNSENIIIYCGTNDISNDTDTEKQRQIL